MGVNADLDGERDVDPLDARGVGAAMRLAESDPTVPLGILFTEFRDANRSVPLNAADRDEVIEQVVQARLSHLSARTVEGLPPC